MGTGMLGSEVCLLYRCLVTVLLIQNDIIYLCLHNVQFFLLELAGRSL